ncbi:TrmB family transcriptional regulator [Halobium palmae]|uniref:TrmB family transcriptional regulator n=1 Tax=Halobium palmae TaxID=1776492 RepID=A0ABD5RYF1_9EURY
MTDLTMRLQEIGLSEYEAAVYAALLRRGTSTASDVSAEADVPQSRVYDVLNALETKGFAVVQPGRPKKFGAIDPESAVDQFCRVRRQQYRSELDEMRQVGAELSDLVGDDDGGAFDRDDADVSWSYSDRHQILDKLAALTGGATEEVLMVTTPTSFERVVNHHAERLVETADGGATIRALVSTDRAVAAPVLEKADELMEIRRVEDIEGRLYTYDASHIVLAFRNPADEGYVGISTRSPHLYRTFAHLFGLMWADSTAVERR